MTLHNEPPNHQESQPLNTQTQSLDIKRLVYPLYQSLLWIRVFAACLILYGALITVTGVGVLIAWLPMWIGVMLFLASKSIVNAYNENDEEAFVQTISRLKTIFITLGLSSVALIIASIYLIKYAIDNSLF
jgi:Na+-transporting methylmalonyl-CoA/oxaloacetate decarboxylase gamma subunit